MSTDQADNWIKSYDDEIEAVKKLGVFQLVDMPINRKNIYTKWVFKTEEDDSINVTKLKAL